MVLYFQRLVFRYYNINLLLITFMWHLFSLTSCVPCSSAKTLHFFMVTLYRSGDCYTINTRWVLILTFTNAALFYLTLEAINVSSQKPCILHTHFAQAYWTLDTLLLLPLDIMNPQNSRCLFETWHIFLF